MSLRLTTGEFVRRAVAVHGSTYDYSLVDYQKQSAKVKIICPAHGVFLQSPGNHVTNSQGCPVCGGTSKLTTESFISKAKSVHGDKYDYTSVVYVNNKSKINITCNVHGVFTQTAADHTSGYGCPSCGGVKRYDTESFIKRAKSIHGDTYEYTVSEYKNKDTPVTIVCKVHGAYQQSPHNHCQNKQGCPSCSKTGYKRSRVGHVYILLSACANHVKVGITNDLKARIDQLRKITPFEFNLLDAFKLSGEQCPIVEKSIHGLLDSQGFSGFNGASEWFKYDVDLMNSIRGLLR